MLVENKRPVVSGKPGISDAGGNRCGLPGLLRSRIQRFVHFYRMGIVQVGVGNLHRNAADAGIRVRDDFRVGYQMKRRAGHV